VNRKLRIVRSKKKYAKKRNPWILDILNDSQLIADINYDKDYLVARSPKKGICAICKGSKFLCGKKRCPIIVRVNSLIKTAPLVRDTEIEGASPPSVFVGRIGYPYVYAGPLVPPIREACLIFQSFGLENQLMKLFISAQCLFAESTRFTLKSLKRLEK